MLSRNRAVIWLSIAAINIKGLEWLLYVWVTAICTPLSSPKITKLLLSSILLRNKAIKHLMILFSSQNLQVAVFSGKPFTICLL